MSQDAYVPKSPTFLSEFRSKWLIAAGSNLISVAGSPTETLHAMVARLLQSGVVIRSQSRFFATPAFPAGAGPDYVNAAFAVESNHAVAEALALLHEIEAEFGREREQRWGQRTLDLDLIGFNDVVIPDAETVMEWINLPLEAQVEATPDQLLVPHPRVQDRAFVLVPLMDVAPDWVHPLLKRSVREMHDALPKADRDGVKPLVNPADRA